MERYWKGNFWQTFVLISSFFIISTVQAQNYSASTTITLNEIALEAPKTDTPRNQLPFSLSVQSVIESQNIYQQLSLQEYLVSIPGLFTQNANNYAQD